MKILDKIIFISRVCRKFGLIYDILNSKEFTNSRIEGEIIRNTHSLEKGLSLEHIRPFFGYEKIKECYNLVSTYLNNGGAQERPMMFVNALERYLQYHTQKGLKSDKLSEINNLYNELKTKLDKTSDYGGVIEMCRPYYTEQEQQIFDKLFNDRHSVREFAHTPIDQTKLKKAIELAMRCPTACNRQCYRLYILSKESFKSLGDLSGIGGFANDAEQFLMITGRMSDYRTTENLQWIVSASVFAGYLTLSLQAVGIGACFIQRDLLSFKSQIKAQANLGVGKDEQLICLMALGNFKDKYYVPVSHRLNFETIVKKI